MEATDKETAGQEAEEEPEEGIYVFIKKTFLQTNPLTSYFYHFLFTIYLEVRLSSHCLSPESRWVWCLSLNDITQI